MTATLHTDDGIVTSVPLADDDETISYTTPRNARYVRAEIRRADGSMVALTNAIHLDHR
jgi:hypothetical protein